MKKTILLFLSSTFLVIGSVSGAIFSKEIISKANELSWEEDKDWISANGTQKAYVGNGEETYIYPLTSSGQHGYYKYKIHLDGLDITWREEGLPKQSTCSGFYLADNTAQYYGVPSVTIWKGLYENQTRVHVGRNHDYNETSIAYQEPECINTGFKKANSMVMNTTESITHAGFRLQVSSYNDTVYKFKFYSVYADSAMWDSNVNYNKDESSCFVFVPKSTITCLDSNGDCYIHYFGFDTNAVSSGYIPYFSFNEKNINAYRETYVTPIQSLLEEYVETMRNASNKEEFELALAKRESFIKTVNNSSLRYHDKYSYTHEKLEAADASVSEHTSSLASELIETQCNAVEEIILDMLDEDNINQTALDSLDNQIDILEEVFDKYKSLIVEAKFNEFTSRIASYKYDLILNTSKLWIIILEKNISKVNDSTNAAEIDNLLSYYKEDAKRSYIELLDEDDQDLLNSRIQNCKNEIDNLFNKYRNKIIDYYLVSWDQLLNKPLTSPRALNDARNYYNYINDRITITSSDNKYNEYLTKYNKLLNACETYINNQIQFIYSTIDEDAKFLEEYEITKTAFNSFKFFDFYFEESPNATKLMNDYVILKNVVESNPLFFFDDFGAKEIQRGSNGVYFESSGHFPERINYNEGLLLDEGIDVGLVVEEYAFYNDGTKANNISINFLNKADSYKSEAPGLNIVLWVYKANCNLKLYNMVDGELASSSISTPKEGEEFHISIEKIIDDLGVAYLILVNDGQLLVRDDLLKRSGIELNDTLYFSLGSFLDDFTYPNCFSIASVNDRDFTQPHEEIERHDYKGE